MLIQNSKSWVKYSFGDAVRGTVAMLLGAFIIRYALQPWIEPYAPFHFFIVACLFIAYLYGYQLALTATLVSAFLGSFFFVKPYFTLGPTVVTDVIQFVNFSSVTVISILIIERLQRTVYARQMVLKIMESRHKISLYRENDRIYFSKKSSEAWTILEEMLTSFDDLVLLQYDNASVKLEPLFYELAGAAPTLSARDAWQALLPPDDLAVLLANLAQPVAHSGNALALTLRFTAQADGVSYPVKLESFIFLGKPLKILRLAKDA
jgi:K+-sensing histidine kinase KdpD